ncbi:UNVERIFIED_CONTAM: hypothetical protein HDU68_004236 [Siphonaria sp. JEL0065]|nr:hypothetical protein HDU68_004236 [Siphonaria sp. JEL0065]
MATIPAASEQTLYTWSADSYYRAGGGICSATDIVVMDYQIPDTRQTTCKPGTCLSTVQGYLSTECVYDIADNLGLKTSQAFGRNVTYAQVKFWYTKGCDSMWRIVHYKVNECVASRADGYFSYTVAFDGINMWNRRYSDPNCQAEMKQASFQYNLTVRDCSLKLWDMSYYSVDILQTVNVPPLPQKEDGPNVGGIVGGILAAIVVLGAVGGYFWYSKKNAHKPLQPLPPPNQSEAVVQPPSPEIPNAPPAPTATNTSVSTLVDIQDNKETIFSTLATEIQLSDEKRPMMNMLNVMAVHVQQQPAVQGFHADRAALVEMKVGVDPSKWTLEETAIWLEKNSFGATGSAATMLELVHKEEIDGAALLALSPDEIVTLLDVTIKTRQIKLKRALEKLKQMSNGQNVGTVAVDNTNVGIMETTYPENPPIYEEFRVAA